MALEANHPALPPEEPIWSVLAVMQRRDIRNGQDVTVITSKDILGETYINAKISDERRVLTVLRRGKTIEIPYSQISDIHKREIAE